VQSVRTVCTLTKNTRELKLNQVQCILTFPKGMQVATQAVGVQAASSYRITAYSSL